MIAPPPKSGETVFAELVALGDPFCELRIVGTPFYAVAHRDSFRPGCHLTPGNAFSAYLWNDGPKGLSLSGLRPL